MSENEIISKETLALGVTQFIIYAPEISRAYKAGQFVLLRGWEGGERIPLTIAGTDPANGTIRVIFQSVGKTTIRFATLNPGDHFLDVAGPLGKPTDIEQYGHVVCIGGGIGVAPLYPIARAMKAKGNNVLAILGYRSKDHIILENDMKDLCDQTILATDDGSAGQKGLVTDILQNLYDSDTPIDHVIAIGPPIMMKFVAEKTRPWQVPTIASLNPIMIDGTGMCGGCRVAVNGAVKFACIDGPEFDAHLVDWDSVMQRLRTYQDHECRALSSYNTARAERMAHAE